MLFLFSKSAIFSPKVVIPQADLKPTEIIRQQINSASKTGRRSSKDYPTRPKSTHYSTKGNIFTNNKPGFSGHTLRTITNPSDYRFLESLFKEVIWCYLELKYPLMIVKIYGNLQQK